MIWNNERENSSDSPSTDHLEQASRVLLQLLEDTRLPQAARARLGEDYRQLKRLIDKIGAGHIYIAVFGRVSVGKSALLNALIGKKVFATSVLNGKTLHSERAVWEEYESGGVFFIDTPGIDEVEGQERAAMAKRVAEQADIVLFVIDADMTSVEREALQALHRASQPMILVLNKVDRLTSTEKEALLAHLSRELRDWIPAEFIVTAAAHPEARWFVDENETAAPKKIQVPPEVDHLRQALWSLLDAGGKSYAALNASLFADALSERLGAEIVAAKREIAERIIRQYALGKALGVALNPIPIVDLLAVAADASMLVHLSKVYGIEMTRHEAGALIRSISIQTGILMGTVYGVNALSSLLKGLTAGLSTIVTAGAQAGVAFYGSYVVGKAGEQYFAQGASWGEGGAKTVIQNIMRDIDREALIEQAKQSVRDYLNRRDD